MNESENNQKKATSENTSVSEAAKEESPLLLENSSKTVEDHVTKPIINEEQIQKDIKEVMDENNWVYEAAIETVPSITTQQSKKADIKDKKKAKIEKKQKKPKKKINTLLKLTFILLFFGFIGIAYADLTGIISLPFSIPFLHKLNLGKEVPTAAPEADPTPEAESDEDADSELAQIAEADENSDNNGPSSNDNQEENTIAEAASEDIFINSSSNDQVSTPKTDEDVFAQLQGQVNDDAIFNSLKTGEPIKTANDKPVFETKDISTPLKVGGTWAFMATWENDCPDIKISLVNPSGVEITKDNISKYGHYYEENKRIQYIIPNAKPGNWNFRVVKPQDIKAGKVEVRAENIGDILKINMLKGLYTNGKVYFVWEIKGTKDTMVNIRILGKNTDPAYEKEQPFIALAKESTLSDKDLFIPSNLEPGTYKFTLQVQESHGVRASQDIEVKID